MKYFTKSFIALLAFATITTACKKDDFDAAEQARIDEDIIQSYIINNNLDATRSCDGYYFVIEERGTGDTPTPTSTVTVNYKGYFTSGSVFDESPGSGSTFSLENVIEGWQRGIPLFNEGGNGILLIPSALAYGNTERGGIPANSVLIFDVAVIDVQ